jgi:hypothetical protein
MKKSTLLLVCFFLSVNAVFSQSDVLYDKAFKAYNNYQWKDAMTLLYSYITYKPVPADFADKVFKDGVIAAYNYARSQYIYSLQKPAQNSDDIVQSSVSGLGMEPPPLRKPKMQMRILTSAYLNNVDGSWQFKIISATGTITPGTLEVSQNGKIVSGTLINPGGRQMQVIGSFDAGVLIMICLTGLETTQVYTLSRIDLKHFSGTFKNVGKWPDSGTIEMY